MTEIRWLGGVLLLMEVVGSCLIAILFRDPFSHFSMPTSKNCALSTLAIVAGREGEGEKTPFMPQCNNYCKKYMDGDC